MKILVLIGLAMMVLSTAHATPRTIKQHAPTRKMNPPKVQDKVTQEEEKLDQMMIDAIDQMMNNGKNPARKHRRRAH